MTSQLESVTTNPAVLASSSSLTVKVIKTTTDTNCKHAMGADATLGKKTLDKNLIYNEFMLKYAL